MSIHWKVLIGLLLGLLLSYFASSSELGSEIIIDYVKPIGIIFIKALKLIAVPLVFVSLAKGITDLKDIGKLSKLGGRTIFWYLASTVFAVVLGLLLVNIFQPGANLDIEVLKNLSEEKENFVPPSLVGKGPLDFFIGMVPDNLFAALSDNGKLLQVIFFTFLFSISLLLLPDQKQRPLLLMIESLNNVMLKMVEFIIAFSPYAVFALMAALIVDIKDPEIFKALLKYSLVLLLGMFILLCLYPLVVKVMTGMPMLKFLKGILPAQLVALSTSSSMATLPVTMEVVQNNLGVQDEVASFVCPVGATINMDATSLMQAIASVFVCQIIGFELSINSQLIIVLTATMASIGAAAAPSAGIVMLVIVLESVGFPSESLPLALTLVLAVDRPLDMCRTVINITGDSCVSVLVNEKVKTNQ